MYHFLSDVIFETVLKHALIIGNEIGILPDRKKEEFMLDFDMFRS
jgi:hypothetical protein